MTKTNFFEENGFDQTIPLVTEMDKKMDELAEELTQQCKEYAESKPDTENTTEVEKKEWNEEILRFAHRTNQLLLSVITEVRKNKLGGNK